MRPMPEGIAPLNGRLRTVTAVVVALVIAAGIFLRFYTHSGLWLDEALTVDRARLPVGQIAGSVKQDGAPPLFYYLLHFWMRLFGQSDLATRSLSGVIGVATLPVVWLAGRRLGGPVVAWTAVVLMASAPFAVYYSTEARMYALVILLTGCGYLALHRALVTPRVGNLVAVAVTTAALLYTQYWALYLVAIVGIWLIIAAWRSRSRPALWSIGAVAVGCLLFVPWLPIFIYQSKYTGTPWAAPPNFTAVINAMTGFTVNQGSLTSVATDQGRLLALIYFAMFALALFGVGRSDRIVELDLHTRPRSRGLTFVVVGTLFAAIAGGILSSSAFSSRYAAVVFLPLILLVALGTATLLSTRVRLAVVALAVVAGMIGSVQNIDTQRTQATTVAAVINTHARPGDLIAYCPDQVGPSVYRLVARSSRYTMETFPRRTGPQFVDWVNYAKVVHAASATAFASHLVAEAGGQHRIWLVWQQGYQTFGNKCAVLAQTLLDHPGTGGHNWVVDNPSKYYEPMNLTEFAPTGS
jgi:mannosyltransferase